MAESSSQGPGKSPAMTRDPTITPGEAGVLDYPQTLFRQTEALKDRYKEAIEKRDQFMDTKLINSPYLDEQDKDAIQSFIVAQIRLTIRLLKKETLEDIATKKRLVSEKDWAIKCLPALSEVASGMIIENPKVTLQQGESQQHLFLGPASQAGTVSSRASSIDSQSTDSQDTESQNTKSQNTESQSTDSQASFIYFLGDTTPDLRKISEFGRIHASPFEAALDSSREYLAWIVSWSYSSNGKRFLRILRVLAHFTVDALKAIIRGEMHNYFLPKGPAGLQVPPTVFPQGKYLRYPMLYALILCNQFGIPPTTHNILAAIDLMERYVQRWKNLSDPGWADSDEEARHSDSIPSGSNERHWEQTENDIHWWTFDKNVQNPHPRRYWTNSCTRRNILRFMSATRAKLSRVPEQDRHKPLPESVAHIGWSTDPKTRKKAHYDHDNGCHPVKALFEACLQVVAHGEGLHFQWLPIMCVTDPELARVAEHTLSLLAHSYTWLGGTNAVRGGDGAMAVRALKRPKEEYDRSIEQNKNGPLIQNLHDSTLRLRHYSEALPKLEGALQERSAAHVEKIIAEAEYMIKKREVDELGRIKAEEASEPRYKRRRCVQYPSRGSI